MMEYIFWILSFIVGAACGFIGGAYWQLHSFDKFCKLVKGEE